MCIINIHKNHWFTTQSATSGPRNDLNLIKELIEYENVNKNVAETAFKSSSGHFRYLSETFFDNQVTIDEKESMALSFYLY